VLLVLKYISRRKNGYHWAEIDLATALEAASFSQICTLDASWLMLWRIATYGFETLLLVIRIVHAKRSLSSLEWLSQHKNWWRYGLWSERHRFRAFQGH
jgi:hypothetical protein